MNFDFFLFFILLRSNKSKLSTSTSCHPSCPSRRCSHSTMSMLTMETQKSEKQIFVPKDFRLVHVIDTFISFLSVTIILQLIFYCSSIKLSFVFFLRHLIMLCHLISIVSVAPFLAVKEKKFFSNKI